MARKHHLVPASYLARWVVKDQVRVTEVDTGVTHCGRPSTLARETDFYSLASPDVDPATVPPLLFEKMLGDTEGAAVQAIDVLLTTQPDDADPELMAEFAWFLAFQMTRGRQYRAGVQHSTNETIKAQLDGLTDLGIRKQLSKKTGQPADQISDEEVAKHRSSLGSCAAAISVLCNRTLPSHPCPVSTPTPSVSTCSSGIGQSGRHRPSFSHVMSRWFGLVDQARSGTRLPGWQALP